jgi:excinuclease UvrABC nuclease subunit
MLTDSQIDAYLADLAKSLITADKRIILLTRAWAKSFPSKAGCYIIRENNEIVYTGESGNIAKRMGQLLTTTQHVIRRNIGEKNFKYLKGYIKATSKEAFPLEIEQAVNSHLKSNMTVSFLPIRLGRIELEEFLINKFKPKYNIKGKIIVKDEKEQ